LGRKRKPRFEEKKKKLGADLPLGRRIEQRKRKKNRLADPLVREGGVFRYIEYQEDLEGEG